MVTDKQQLFRERSDERFGSLDGYVTEKIEDGFPIEGNELMTTYLRQHLGAWANQYQKAEKITIMDGGPAVGAISTLFALKELDQYGLLGKTEIYLVDISQDVLSKNIQVNFPRPPTDFIEEHFGSVGYYDMLRAKLTGAIPLKNAIDDHLELDDKSIDISLVGFLLHHIPDEGKESAAREIMRVTRRRVFVADEYFDDYERDFAACHKDDEIALAPEEPVPLDVSLSLFTNQNENALVEHCQGGDKTYAYCISMSDYTPQEFYGEEFVGIIPPQNMEALFKKMAECGLEPVYANAGYRLFPVGDHDLCSTVGYVFIDGTIELMNMDDPSLEDYHERIERCYGDFVVSSGLSWPGETARVNANSAAGAIDHAVYCDLSLARLNHLGWTDADPEMLQKRFIERLQNALDRSVSDLGSITREDLKNVICIAREGSWRDKEVVMKTHELYYALRGEKLDLDEAYPST